MISNNAKMNYSPISQHFCWLFHLTICCILFLIVQCGNSNTNAMFNRASSFRVSSLNRASSLRSVSFSGSRSTLASGAPTRLQIAAEQKGLNVDELSLFHYETRLLAKINELTKEIHLCEGTMISPGLITRTHQLAKNALVVAIAYDDVLHNIYPELEASLKEENEKMLAAHRDKQNAERNKKDYLNQMIDDTESYENRHEHDKKIIQFDNEIKNFELKKDLLKECIADMKSDYGLIEDAAKQGITIVDIQERAESIANPSVYQEKFTQFLQERRVDYVKKAEKMVENYKEIHKPVTQLRRIEPFAPKPPLYRPPLPRE